VTACPPRSTLAPEQPRELVGGEVRDGRILGKIALMPGSMPARATAAIAGAEPSMRTRL
jgi:hypothetical protein